MTSFQCILSCTRLCVGRWRFWEDVLRWMSDERMPREVVKRLSTWHSEKEHELQGLNERLAAYLEKVDFLEAENVALREALDRLRGESDGFGEEMRKVYEDERNVLREELDTVHRECTRLRLENGRITEMYEGAVEGGREGAALLARSEQRVEGVESELVDCRARLEEAQNRLEKANEKLRRAEEKVAGLLKQLDEAKSELDAEVLARIDVSNQNMSLKEECEFRRLALEREAVLVSRSSMDLDSIESAVRERCNANLEERLNRLKEESEAKIVAFRKDAEKKVCAKLSRERERADRAIDSLRILQENHENTKKRLEEANCERDALSDRTTKLTGTIVSLERQLDIVEDAKRCQSESQQREIDRLTDRLAELQSKFDDLLEINVTLDQEIETYKKLVESGEERLVRKRRRLDSDDRQTRFSLISTHSDEGPVAIVNSADGIVKLVNLTKKTISLSGWVLKWLDDEHQDSLVEFKFPRNAVIESETYIVSSTHAKPPQNGFRLRHRCWPSSENPHIVLLEDSNGNTVSKLSAAYIEHDDDDDEAGGGDDGIKKEVVDYCGDCSKSKER